MVPREVFFTERGETAASRHLDRVGLGCARLTPRIAVCADCSLIVFVGNSIPLSISAALHVEFSLMRFLLSREDDCSKNLVSFRGFASSDQLKDFP